MALVRSLAAGVLLLAAAVPAHAQNYPHRPIRFVVPFAPGMRTGSDHGLGISYGVGLSFAVTRTVDLRLDWDRYRMKFETGRNYADLASVGVAFKF